MYSKRIEWRISKAKMRKALNEECDKIDLLDDTGSFESSDISEIEDDRL